MWLDDRVCVVWFVCWGGALRGVVVTGWFVDVDHGWIVVGV